MNELSPQPNFKRLKIASVLTGVVGGILYTALKLGTGKMPSGNLISIVVIAALYRALSEKFFAKFLPKFSFVSERLVQKLRWVAFAESFLITLSVWEIFQLVSYPFLNADQINRKDPTQIQYTLGFGVFLLVIVNVRYVLITRKIQEELTSPIRAI